MACCCPCCFTHYKGTSEPVIGKELIESHDARTVKMTGDSLQVVEITIPPQMTMIGEPGAWVYSESGVQMETLFMDGATVNEPGCCAKSQGACVRQCAGESASVSHLTNTAQVPRVAAFSSIVPGEIVAINLGDLPGKTLFTMNGSFHFAAKGTRIGVVRADCMQGCCGSGYLFQKLDGNGMVFLSAGGAVVKVDLKGQKERLDSAALVAFTTGLDINVERAGGCCTMCCAGEGMAFTTLEGTGSYWISSAPWTTQLENMLSYLPDKKG